MKYPQKSPYLIYSHIGDNEYTVENRLTSERYRLDYMLYTFLRRLDGKRNPYSILPGVSRDVVRLLINDLREANLLASEKRIQRLGIGSCMYPLIYCYPGKTQKQLAKTWNYVLMMAFIPFFLIGLYLSVTGEFSVQMQSKSELYVGIVLGVGVGILLHELSHMCAGLTYGGQLFEMGVGTHCFLPMGYVLLDTEHIQTRTNKLQIYMAGIEINLLLYGVFMCLVPIGFLSPFVLYLAAIENLALATFNLLPFDGLDGIMILSTILGQTDILRKAKGIIKKRKCHRKTGKNSTAVIAAYVLVGFQLLMPFLIAYEGYCLVRLIIF